MVVLRSSFYLVINERLGLRFFFFFCASCTVHVDITVRYPMGILLMAILIH